PVAEFSEHTGRAEAPGAVEIRARAAGHLERAAFREGELVKKGDLLFVVDPRPYRAALARARADLEAARADHALAEKNAARADALYQSNAIAARERDELGGALAQLSARRAAAAAAVSAAELDLDYALVRSPIDGRIGRVLVTPGNLVGPGTASPLATVVSVDPLYVYVDVDEARALGLRAGGGAAAARIGFPGEAGYPHEARVDFLDNRVDPATGTLKVRAVVPNPDGRLSPGLFARVRLTQGAPRDAVLVADRAVATDQDRRFVWVVGPGERAQYRGVKLGHLEGGLRVVREGLAASDRVVVRGLQRLRPGVEVAAELVAMGEVDGAPGGGDRPAGGPAAGAGGAAP
ncbi:MAG TPA: efflux RND transporter periplasmic adaptor subunit, partial [Polyangiaceae bacterium]|nr:efflux RND transporter periplasmic adaptor subunit [Polyangiaceae bacterium]